MDEWDDADRPSLWPLVAPHDAGPTGRSGGGRGTWGNNGPDRSLKYTSPPLD